MASFSTALQPIRLKEEAEEEEEEEEEVNDREARPRAELNLRHSCGGVFVTDRNNNNAQMLMKDRRS